MTTLLVITFFVAAAEIFSKFTIITLPMVICLFGAWIANVALVDMRDDYVAYMGTKQGRRINLIIAGYMLLVAITSALVYGLTIHPLNQAR